MKDRDAILLKGQGNEYKNGMNNFGQQGPDLVLPPESTRNQVPIISPFLTVSACLIHT